VACGLVPFLVLLFMPFVRTLRLLPLVLTYLLALLPTIVL
jgi:hypothetical protein